MLRLLQKFRKEPFDEGNSSIKVDIHHFMQDRKVAVFEFSAHAHSSIVDKDVDRFIEILSELKALGLFVQVKSAAVCLHCGAMLLGQFLAEIGDALKLLSSIGHQPDLCCTHHREVLGKLFAYSGTGAGDQHSLAFELRLGEVPACIVEAQVEYGWNENVIK